MDKFNVYATSKDTIEVEEKLVSKHKSKNKHKFSKSSASLKAPKWFSAFEKHVNTRFEILEKKY